MPVELRFGADDLTRCRFAVSPLCETHEAVRTLRRAERHAFHLPWLRRTGPAAAALDLAELWLLMPSPGYTPDFLGPPPEQPYTTPVTFAVELARLRATDPALAAREIACSLATTPGAATSPAAHRLLADPAATVQRLADTTERAWHTLVEPDWPRLRAVLEADIAYRSRRLAATGLAALLTTLHPHLTYRSHTLHLHTPPPTRPHPLPGFPQRPTDPDPVSGSRQRPTAPDPLPDPRQRPTGPDPLPGSRQRPTGPDPLPGSRQRPTGLDPVSGSRRWPGGRPASGDRQVAAEHQPAPGSRDLAGRGLLLMPSVFSWPEPVTGFADPWQPAVIYPARGIDTLWQPAAPAGTLVRLLGANRAALLSALTEPTSTTELARRHGLAPSSVSAHLSVLRAAGLLTAHRDRHHVLYERTALGTALTGP